MWVRVASVVSLCVGLWLAEAVGIESIEWPMGGKDKMSLAQVFRMSDAEAEGDVLQGWLA
jgi:hypothetical protein